MCSLLEHSYQSARTWAAIILFVAGGTLGICSSMCLVRLGQGTPLPSESPRHLVIAGPYKVLRNPMAVAGLVQGLGVAVWLNSAVITIYVLLGGLVWNALLRPLEEHDLHARFGAGYNDYRHRVRCWIPRP